jgi:pyruvate dehydrogenase kinase 2/3/4
MSQLSPNLRKKINQYSLQKIKGVSVQSLTNFGSMKIPKQRKLAMSAEYLLNELRVRYSHMIHEVNALPYAETSPIPMVIQLCAKTLEELFSHPEISLNASENTVTSFSNLLQRSLERHKNEKLLLAQGLFEWKHHNPSLYNEMSRYQND